jgi:hypothetical protein
VGLNKSLFTSTSCHWATPKALYEALDAEFHFNDDPCPLGGSGGLDRRWGSRTYLNPPYGREIGKWLKKAVFTMGCGGTVVCLVPSRTDTSWWHELIMPYAKEIRFLRGRLHFNESKNSAPFPSAIIVFRGNEC